MSPTTYQSPYKPTPTSTLPDTFIRWLRLKKYRIEVTYGVYVYTPMEKVVFWTLFCSLFVFISTAILVYTQRSIAFFLRVILSDFDSPSGSLVAAPLSGLITTSAAAAAAQQQQQQHVHGEALLRRLTAAGDGAAGVARKSLGA